MRRRGSGSKMNIKFTRWELPIIYGATTKNGGHISPYHIVKVKKHRLITLEKDGDVESFHLTREKAMEWLVAQYAKQQARAKREEAIYKNCVEFWRQKLADEDVFTEYQK